MKDIVRRERSLGTEGVEGLGTTTFFYQSLQRLEEELALVRRKGERLEKLIRYFREEEKERVTLSLQSFDYQVYRGDFHVHSLYSDGSASVEDIYLWKEIAGLDFVFVTDHDTLEQREDCLKCSPDLWWGEEVTAGAHHILLLGLEKKVGGYKSLAQGAKVSNQLQGFVVIAHPAGWNKNIYPPELIREAEEVKENFLVMEIGNGYNSIFDYFDESDNRALDLWDRLLLKGRRVIGIGNTDSHLAVQLGSVWNGIITRNGSKEGVLQALGRGHIFVSNGPAIVLSLGDSIMGDEVQVREDELEFKVECADSRGIKEIKIIRGGLVIKEISGGSEVKKRVVWKEKFPPDRKHTYYRAECFSVDGRRAYTNPIWVSR